MKKLFLLILVLALALGCFASCDMLPESVQDGIDSVLGMVGLGGDEDVSDEPHEHSFEYTSTKDPTCSLPGKETYTCSCGETEIKEVGEPLGHDFKESGKTAATCNKNGGTKYKCTRCGFSKTDSIPATGHNFGPFVEASRLIPCLNDYCSYAMLSEGNGKYKEVFVYKFTEEDIAAFDSVYAELDYIISSADPYDPDLHAFDEGSENHDAYLIMEAKYLELDDVLEYVTYQYQVAQIEYHMSMNNTEKKERYDYISQVRTDLVSRYYSFYDEIYDSMFRDYFYYGMTDEEIQAIILECDGISNPEYKALTDRNKEIELEFYDIVSPETDERVPVLYAEFVENNKRIAELMGYDNYLEFAYENVYERDYTYQDVQLVVGNVKKYMTSIYSDVYGEWNNIVANLTTEAYDAYTTYVLSSFFSDYEANTQLNDYIDLMAFTSNPDKNITFSDELNNLMSDGNLFIGQYKGAYVTHIYEVDIPIAYFETTTYSGAFTVAHEFGHYMNEIYSGGKYSQSFDLLESHSQGNEMLFLSYLKNNGGLTEDGMHMVEVYELVSMLDSIMHALAVDTFEQAVYTDTYSGVNASKIMADGAITADEYDFLFESIIQDLGGSANMSGEYWRYVTISSPCYYVSYAVSAISVLQLYTMANNDFDAAKEAYLKLFSYVDEYEKGADYMTMEEVFEYAGLYSFTDPELYKMYKEEFTFD